MSTTHGAIYSWVEYRVSGILDLKLCDWKMIPYIIIITGSIAWLLPPFRQYKTKYFLFFLILASIEPIMDILGIIFHLSIVKIYPVFGILVLFSLIKLNRKNIVLLLGFITAGILIVCYFPELVLRIFMILIQTMILLVIIYDFLIFTNEHKTLNLFFILLILYQIMVVYKFVARILDIHNGIVIFYLSGFIQIFFGILFTLFNVNSKNFQLFKEDIIAKD